MLPEHIEKSIEDDMGKGMKKLMADDLWPQTMTFFLAKLSLQQEVFKKYGIKLKFRLDKGLLGKGYRMNAFCLLLNKLKVFRNYSVIRFMDKASKFHYKFRPRRWLKMNGHKFLMNEGDASMRAILRDYEIIAKKSVWEPETTKLVEKYVHPGDVCLDVGASVGYFTLLMSRQGGKVLAFEPTTNQIPYLRSNIKKNGYSAKVFHMGAWDRPEVIEMPVHAPIKYKVECDALDNVLEKEGIDEVDFIKIDVDGVEPRVLRGLIRTIERSPNLKMVIEFYPEYIKNAGCDPDEFMEIINKYFTYEVVPGDYSDGCWNYFCTRR